MSEILQHVKNPVSLLGLVLILVFSVHRLLLSKGIIPQLDKKTGGLVVFAILRYGFWISIATLICGVVLSFKGLFPDVHASSYVGDISNNEDVINFRNFLGNNDGRIVYLDFGVFRDRVTVSNCSFGMKYNFARPGDPAIPDRAPFEDTLGIYVFMPGERDYYEIGHPNAFGIQIYGSHGDLTVRGFFSVGGEYFGHSWLGPPADAPPITIAYALYPVDRVSGHDRIGRR